MGNFGVRSRNINSQREKSPTEEIGQGGEDYFFLGSGYVYVLLRCRIAMWEIHVSTL